MSKALYSELQADMKAAGLYTLGVDGDWGKGSRTAFLAARNGVRIGKTDKFSHKLLAAAKAPVWSAKVSQTFIDRIEWTAENLGMQRAQGVDDLMACMAWESAETFRADIRNAAGSGATGLIQFMPATAIVYFNSLSAIANMTKVQRDKAGREACDRLAAMTPEDQINYVYKYFLTYKGKLKNLGDVYMAILYPKGIGRADSWVLWHKSTMPKTFAQNAGLDINKDGAVTRGECLQKVNEKMVRGLDPVHLRIAC